MADSPVWIRFFIEDFERDTRHLTPLEVGIYLRLILWYYRNAGPPPDVSLGRIALSIGLELTPMQSEEPLDALKSVMAQFFDEHGRQKRCDIELTYWRGRVQAARESALHKHSRINGFDANAERMQSDGTANALLTRTRTRTRTRTIKPNSKLLASSPSGLSAGEVVISIPCNTGAEVPIYKPFVEELEKAYPDVDAIATLREVRAWCIANPTKRKTGTGMARFVNSWFARVQNA